MTTGAAMLFSALLAMAACRTVDEDDAVRRTLRKMAKISRPKTLPPSGTSDTPVMVRLNYHLRAITDLSLKGYLEAMGWLSLQWTDPRLSFSPEDAGNLTTLKVDPEDIWVPDVEIYNLAPSGFEILNTRLLAQISTGGEVFLVYNVATRTLCDVIGQISTRQVVCRMKFGSWVFNGFEMDFQEVDPHRNMLDDFQTTNIWTVTSSNETRNEVYYPCCPSSFPDITIEFTVEGRVP